MREALISSSPLPIIVLTVAGEIMLWNQAAERVFGWSAGEVMGGPLPFIPSERQDEYSAFRAQDVSGQASAGREIRRKCKDGSTVELSLSTAPLHDKAGNISGTLCIYVDITGQKQVQYRLARQARELARSNADLQQFAHVVSHDLQEPLRAITSYAQLLERRYSGKLDPSADDFLKHIVGGARRMGALIQDLLAYSRVMEGEGPGADTVDLAAVAHNALQTLSLTIRETNAEVICADLPSVEGHRVALDQLLVNLLNNALKYRKPDTPPRVEIRVEQANDEWIFRVSDNGVGIDPHDHTKIFAIFQRLDSTGVEGTGIGLALCQKIVERHGGRIWVESEFGRGATFFFTLPTRRS